VISHSKISPHSFKKIRGKQAAGFSAFSKQTLLSFYVKHYEDIPSGKELYTQLHLKAKT